jgi:hypothetical protein
MSRRVALVRTDVSEERSASIFRLTVIGALGTTLAITRFLRSFLRLLVTTKVPSSTILVALMMEAIRSSEMSVFTGATRRYIQEDGILHYEFIIYFGENRSQTNSALRL